MARWVSEDTPRVNGRLHSTAETSSRVDDEDAHAGPSLSRCTSLSSISPELLVADYLSSDELDKLSSCLSETSSEPSSQSSSLIYDVVQAQVTLWTLVFSILYSYAWRQHRKKFLVSIFFVIPTVFAVTCAISTLLSVLVVLGRLFSTPIPYDDFLKMGRDVVEGGGEGRRRSVSGASVSSVASDDVCSVLPRPLCRRHSSNTSLNQPPSRPPSRRFSYSYRHQNPIVNTSVAVLPS